MFGMDDSAISAGPSSYHGSPMMSSTLKEFEVKDLMVYVSKAANASRKVRMGPHHFFELISTPRTVPATGYSAKENREA